MLFLRPDQGLTPAAGPSRGQPGRTLATGSRDNTARIWDAATATGRPLVKVTHNEQVRSVAFSPDAVWLATGSADSTARVWDAATGRPLTTITHHGGGAERGVQPGRELAGHRQ